MLHSLLTSRLSLGRRLTRGALRLVFPDLCPWCGRPLAPADSPVACHVCEKTVARIDPPFCHRCGLPLDGGVMPITCARCLADPPHYDRLRGVVVYNDQVAAAIHALKYKRRLTIVYALATVLYHVHETGIRWTQYDAIVPVPLFARRFRERWFNQSLLLASALPDIDRLPLRPTLLRRVRDTPRQADLAQSDRLTNLKGAFAVAPHADLDGLRILLIDDVATTGATFNECAKVCKQAGAAVVDAACVARAAV